MATPTDTVAWLDWVLQFMFETEPFKCFLVLSIDLDVDSPFYDVATWKLSQDSCSLPFLCRGTTLEFF